MNIRIPVVINLSRANYALLVLCGFFMPIGEGISQLVPLDVSKLFPILVALLIACTFYTTRIPLNYFPPFFVYFVLFAMLHTCIVYLFVHPQLLFMTQGEDSEIGIIVIIRFFLFALYAFAVGLNIRSLNDFKNIFIAYSIGFALSFVLGVYITFSELSEIRFSRIQGGFGNANVFGTAAMMVFFSNLILLNFLKLLKWEKRMIYFFLFLSVIAMVLSQSRAVYVAVIIAGVYLASKYRGIQKKIKYFIMAFLFIFIFAFFLPTAVIDNLKQRININERIESNKEERVIIWKEYLQQLPVYVVQGVGRGRALSVVEDKTSLWVAKVPHNFYLAVLVEFGIIGFFLLIVALTQIWKRVKFYKEHDVDKVNVKYYIMSAFLISVLVTVFFSDSITSRDMWMFFGIACSYGHWKKQLENF